MCKLKDLFTKRNTSIDAKKIKGLSEKTQQKALKKEIKNMDKTIKQKCKQGDYSHLFHIGLFNSDDRHKIITYYRDRGFDVNIVFKYFIRINWK